ncbi:MAG: hypothetical protein B7Z08_09605 [Sphingomonadales bacterium 32-68-7]|nr:MAG: hypothetical protein B7Z33_06665 [Sphingomonadales bacterium 12-68-11]OYX08438.1 MAG: hypothetical protein B7Z08_09605 [Sphingomonadales bacterium 32-68-7]
MAGSAPTGYSGQGFSLPGEKGRFVLPPSFRKAIAPTDDTPRKLCLAKHDRWPCLTGFAESRTDLFEAQVTREQDAALKLGKEFDWEQRMAQLWSFQDVPFDSSGRFVLPEGLASVCDLGEGIAFLGGSPFFTLWPPKALFAMGTGWEGQQAVCRSQQAEALGKRK